MCGLLLIYGVTTQLGTRLVCSYSVSASNRLSLRGLTGSAVQVGHHRSPGEITRREVSWTFTKKLAQKRSSAGMRCWARERERVGLLLLQLFSNGGATDTVFVTVLHNSWDSDCVVLWSLRNAGRTLP